MSRCCSRVSVRTGPEERCRGWRSCLNSPPSPPPPPGRRKKLRFHPRQLYLSVKQGELQKVILMLRESSGRPGGDGGGLPVMCIIAPVRFPTGRLSASSVGQS